MNFRAILSSFSFNPQADTFLTLTCRPSGLLSWPLSKLRLADTGTLTINRVNWHPFFDTRSFTFSPPVVLSA